MTQAILSGWMHVPLSLLPPGEEEQARAMLSHKSRFEENDLEAFPIFEERPGFLLVPRAYGLHRYGHLPVIDQLSDGEPFVGPIPKRPDPNHVRVRNPQAQAKFMADLINGAREWESFLATAPTGSGKTVCALNMAAELGRKTMILVHLERLGSQWADEIHDKLGVPKERIGIMQGQRFDYHEKDFVVGMLHTLNLNDGGLDFYRSFGTVIFDEVHKVGTRFFSPSCGYFPARYKVGLSATLKRKDGGDKVFVWHLGPVRVRSQAEAMPCKVYVMNYCNPRHKKYGQKPGAVAKCLSTDRSRNEVIAKVIKRFYDAERNGLIVGFSVMHLQNLMQMAAARGVPLSAMGLFTGERYVSYDDNGIVRWKKRKQKPDELSFVKKNARLVFATYGMITEGIDEPRWDAGIDVTPRGSATQLIGRIRRPLPGKKDPTWVTIRDTDHPTAEGYFKSRMKDYRSSNAEVVFEYGKKKEGAD